MLLSRYIAGRLRVRAKASTGAFGVPIGMQETAFWDIIVVGGSIMPTCRQVGTLVWWSLILALAAGRGYGQEDTYGCLINAPAGANIIEVSGNFGYEFYTISDWPANTIFDARKGHWLQQVRPEILCVYPIRVGNSKNDRPAFCWVGGLVEGTNDSAETWCRMYVEHNTGIMGHGQGMTIDGIRIHNVFDGFNVANSPGFTIKNCWVTYNRDDAIENDGFMSGTIDDCLFDGLHVFLSSVNPSSTTPDGSANVVKVSNNLIRMERTPGPREYGGSCDPNKEGYGAIFKYWDGRAPKVELHNNIFLLPPQTFTTKQALLGIEAGGKLKSCSGNVLVWTGDGDVPRSEWLDLPDGCFEITKDVNIWNNAKKAWIDRHPELARLDTDPKSETPTIQRRPGSVNRIAVESKSVRTSVELYDLRGRRIAGGEQGDMALRSRSALPPGVLVAVVRESAGSIRYCCGIVNNFRRQPVRRNYGHR